jgi:hypothetical protein
MSLFAYARSQMSHPCVVRITERVGGPQCTIRAPLDVVHVCSRVKAPSLFIHTADSKCPLPPMSSPQQSQLLVRLKARRAANNNYLKLSKTLCKKLSKLCRKYDADIYFLAYRNGRYRGFVSTNEQGQPWSPPSQDALVSHFLSPALPHSSI